MSWRNPRYKDNGHGTPYGAVCHNCGNTGGDHTGVHNDKCRPLKKGYPKPAPKKSDSKNGLKNWRLLLESREKEIARLTKLVDESIEGMRRGESEVADAKTDLELTRNACASLEAVVKEKHERIGILEEQIIRLGKEADAQASTISRQTNALALLRGGFKDDIKECDAPLTGRKLAEAIDLVLETGSPMGSVAATLLSKLACKLKL